VSHAVRMPAFGPVEPAYLPNVGDVYLVSPRLLGSRDDPGHDPGHGAGEPVPVVVIVVPRLASARIQVVTRTSDRSAAGIPHGPAPQLGLHQRGVWTNVVTVDKSVWTSRDARWRGPLERIVLADVLERFE
jgi:hypothetical protein